MFVQQSDKPTKSKNTFISMENEYIQIRKKEIIGLAKIRLLRADINYTEVHMTNGKKILTTITIGSIETNLPSGKFFRVNRGTIVNIDYVSSYQMRSDYDKILLNDNTEIKVSRRRRLAMRKTLQPNYHHFC